MFSNETSQDNNAYSINKGFDALRNLKLTTTLTDAYSLELKRELEMQEAGRQRYLDKLEKTRNLSTQNEGNRIITDEQAGVMDYLSKVINTSLEGVGRQFTWMPYIQDVPIQTLSIIALSVMLDAASMSLSRNKTLVNLGRFVEMENWGIWLRSRDSDLEKRVLEKVKKDHSSLRYRVKAMKAIAAKEGHKKDSWPEDTRAKVGSLLYNAVFHATDLFEEFTEHKKDKAGKPRETIRIGLQKGANDRLSELQESASWQAPVFSPMIVPPVEWKTYNDMTTVNPYERTAGCYYEVSLASQVTLVRGATGQQIQDIKRGIKDGTLQPMLDALNLIQVTPLEINVPILEALEWAWEQGVSVGKFPRKDHLPDIVFPENYDTLDTKQQKHWRMKQRKVIQKNRQIDGDRLVMEKYDLPLARELATLETKAFYLPHSWDFRGRVYPVPSFSHHRADHIKALFLLHNKKPVGEQGTLWMAIKLADLGDFNKISKQPIEARLKWVEDNQEKICDIARDFKGHFKGNDPDKLYWGHADKPFQFLAACFELANIITHGDTYESGFPIGLDGSNSGVQHYAGMLRSSEEGFLVNLTPQERPQDIYEAVASVVRDSIKEEAKPDDISEAWAKFRVGRKTLKRNVMTFSYSSNMFGFRKQIMQDFMGPINDAVLAGEGWEGNQDNPFEVEGFNKDGESTGPDEGWQAAGYLAKKSWSAVTSVILSASEGMGFLKKLSNLCSDEGKLMRWTTPMGFPISQRYTKNRVKPVMVFLHDRKYEPLVRKKLSIEVMDEREVNKTKSASSIAPNFVHGLDSSHLHATVLKCFDKYGITDFFMIHDSFGTTPAETGAMYQAVREAFIEQYEDRCIFSELLEQVKDQLDQPEKAVFPEVPAKGTLDINEVMESKYCFL